MKVALRVTGITYALLVGIVIILLFSTNHHPKGNLLTEALSPIKNRLDWK